MSPDALLHLAVLLAQEAPDPEDVKPGWLGFTVFLALAAAVVVLSFSFRKQLRKAREHFDGETTPETGETGQPGTGEAGPTRADGTSGDDQRPDGTGPR